MRLVLLAIAAIWLPIKVGQWGGTMLNMQDRHENLKGWVVVEEATHGLLGMTVCLPLFWNRRRAPFLIIPFLLATAPDFDHVMTAKERVQSVTINEEPRDYLEYAAMGTRGSLTHSLVVAYIAAGVLFLLTQRLDWAWVLAMALSSHMIRDAHTAPLAIFYPSPTIYELELRPYLYWESALGALTFGVMFIYGPVRAFLRRVTRGGLGSVGLLIPLRTPSDWAGGVPVVAKSSSHQRSRHSSRNSSSRRRRHSSDEGEHRHNSSSGSRAHRRSHSDSSADR